MKKFISILFLTLCVSISSFSQTITDLINEVNQDSLVKVLRAFSGEDQTMVNGSPVTLINRISSDNDEEAEYLKQKFSALNNITINDQVYSANGRNIIATQLGKTNPNNIYIVCAHYDALHDYSADDNASGTAAVLEIARILSEQCFDNTIIYALWDEEEQGLLGSKFYADAAAVNGNNILGVINLDMMAYDGDGDNDFDIDVRNIAGSLSLKDDFVNVLGTSGLNLNVNVVDPGTTASDHAWFWTNGFPAIFVGESWANGDQTPHYHSASDRFSTLDIPYFTEITKLVLAYMATAGNLVGVDNTVGMTANNLTANQVGATYQWLDCNNNNTPIPSETNQVFTPSSNGNYAVQITVGNCTEISKCFNFNTLELLEFDKNQINVYPNPVKSNLNIDLVVNDVAAELKLTSLEGKEVLKKHLLKSHNEINLSALANGVYFVNIEVEGKTVSYKIVKE